MRNFDLTFTMPDRSKGAEERRCKTTYTFDVVGELVQIKEEYFNVVEVGDERREGKTFFLKRNYSDKETFIYESDNALPGE